MTPAIKRALRAAWSADVSFTPDEWTPENPSRGCCGVTAVAVWLICGNDILMGRVSLGTQHHAHYWNAGLDLTLEQFPAGSYAVDTQPVFIEDVLSNAWFRERAALYLRRVFAELDGRVMPEAV